MWAGDPLLFTPGTQNELENKVQVYLPVHLRAHCDSMGTESGRERSSEKPSLSLDSPRSYVRVTEVLSGKKVPKEMEFTYPLVLYLDVALKKRDTR